MARVPVEDASSVSPARALAVAAAQRAGMSTADVDRAALVATELAENLHRHAVGGELAVVEVVSGHSADVVLVALDRGPGVSSIARCFTDGYSTAGTLGTGLGAVARLSASVDAVSELQVGTVVTATLRRSRASAGRLDDQDDLGPDVAAFGFPLGAQTVNGDGWALARRGAAAVVMLADGLGHGPDAAAASGAASAVVARGWPGTAPAQVVTSVHREIAHTRGAAVTVAVVEDGVLERGGTVAVAGVGNVSALVADPDGATRRTATSYGTAGVRLPRTVSEQHPAVVPGSVVVLHTDGLTSRWSLAGRAPLVGRSALVIAAALWRDHARGTDDSLVVVMAPRHPRLGARGA